MIYIMEKHMERFGQGFYCIADGLGIDTHSEALIVSNYSVLLTP